MIDVEERALSEVFWILCCWLTEQHLTLDLGEGNERLGGRGGEGRGGERGWQDREEGRSEDGREGRRVKERKGGKRVRVEQAWELELLLTQSVLLSSGSGSWVANLRRKRRGIEGRREGGRRESDEGEGTEDKKGREVRGK